MDDFKQKIREQIIGIGNSKIPTDEKDVLRVLYTRWKDGLAPITQKELAEQLPNIGGHKKHDTRTEETTLRQVRQVVRDLRTLRWAPILADVRGYYIPSNEQEAKDYMERVEREVRARVVASFETYTAMKESLGITSTFLDGQMKLLETPLSTTEKSATTIGKVYRLYHIAGRGWVCECPSFKYREKCRHVVAAAQRATMSTNEPKDPGEHTGKEK